MIGSFYVRSYFGLEVPAEDDFKAYTHLLPESMLLRSFRGGMSDLVSGRMCEGLGLGLKRHVVVTSIASMWCH